LTTIKEFNYHIIIKFTPGIEKNQKKPQHFTPGINIDNKKVIILAMRILNQGFLVDKLMSSLRKVHGSHYELAYHYGISG
jgi:hypothetical protein